MGLQRGSEWDHVIELHVYEGSIGIKHWKCKYCQHAYTGSWTKIKAHLVGDISKQIAGCVQVPVEVMRMFSNVQNYEKEVSNQHPILSHTLAHNVQ